MKRKHYSIAAIALVLVSISAVAFRLSNGLGKGQIAGPSLIKPEHLLNVSVPGSSTIKEMKRLQKLIPHLINPIEPNSSKAQLGLFGYYKHDGRAAIRTTGKRDELSSSMDYALSLAFWGNEKRFCVIDDKFYHEGASLPDGGEIVRIELNRVLVKKKDFTSWITLEKQTDVINNTEPSGDKM